MDRDDLDDWNPMCDHYVTNFGGGYGQRSPEGERRGMHPTPDNRRNSHAKLHISQIPDGMNNAELGALFSLCGTIVGEIGIVETSDGYRIGQLQYKHTSEAVAAIKAFHHAKPYNMNVCHFIDRFDRQSQQHVSQYRGKNLRGRMFDQRSGTRMPVPLMASRNAVDHFNGLDSSFGSLSVRMTNSERTVTVDNSPIRRESPIGQLGAVQTANTFRTCIQCRREGSFKCTRCDVCYCSKECQTLNWGIHKELCGQPRNFARPRIPDVSPSTFTSRNASEGRSSRDSSTGQRRGTNDGQNSPQYRGSSFSVRGRHGGHQSISGHNERTSTIVSESNGFCGNEPINELEDQPVFSSECSDVTSLSMPINVLTEVEVTHFESPSHFFLHLCERREERSVLMGSLQVDALQKPVPERLSCDHMVAAKFTDGSWYRGVVKELNGADTVSVYYIDYGNVETIKRIDVRLLPKKLALPSPKCVLCNLANVRPEEKNWTATEIAAFKNRLQTCKLYAICLEVVHGKHAVLLKDDKGNDVVEHLCVTNQACPKLFSAVDTWKVDDVTKLVFTARNSESELWLMAINPAQQEDVETVLSLSNDFSPATDNHFADVGELVCARSPSDDAWYRAVIRRKSDAETLVQFVDFGNSEVVTELCRLPEKYQGLPTLAVLSMFKSEAEATKAQASMDPSVLVKVVEVCSDYGTVRLSMGDETVEVVVYSVTHERFVLTETVTSAPISVDPVDVLPLTTSVPSTSTVCSRNSTDVAILDLPMPLEETSVIVLNVESSDIIYVRIVTGPYLSLLPDLQVSLSKTCDSLAPLSSLPNVGSFICGQYTADDMWYRGHVIETYSFNEVLVRYIDFGNKELLPLSRIKPLLPDFIGIPSLAFRVKMDVGANVGVDQLKVVFAEVEGENCWSMFVTDVSTSPVTVQLTKEGLSLNRLLTEDEHVDSSDVPTLQSRCSSVAPIYSELEQEILPVQLDNGNQTQVVIVDVFSDGRFYCCVVDADRLIALDSLVANISEWCESARSSPVMPVARRICLAKSTEYGEWYRARVLFVHDDKCWVFYVDHGTSEVVPSYQLRSIVPEFCLFPSQVVECKLDEFNYGNKSFEAVRSQIKDGGGLHVLDVIRKEDEIYIVHCDNLANIE